MGPDCYRFRRRLSQLLDETLSPVDAARVQDHLARCERCAGEFELLRKTRDLVTSLEPLEVPADFTERVVEAARRQQESAPASPWIPSARPAFAGRRRTSTWVLGLAAAAAVAALAVGLWALKTTPRMNSAPAPMTASTATPQAAAHKPALAVVPKGAAEAPAPTVRRGESPAAGPRQHLASTPGGAFAQQRRDSLYDQPYQGGEIAPEPGYSQRVHQLPDSGVHVTPVSSRGRNK